MPDTPHSLLERLALGNAADDWAELLTVYRPLLWGWVRPHVAQDADADDILQDALAVVAHKLPEFRHNGSPGAFRAWLRATVVLKVRQFWRAAERVPDALDPTADRTLADLEQPDSEAGRRWNDEHDRLVLARLLDRIRPEFTPTTWEAFRRYALEGQPPAAVAAAVGVSANAVFIARSRVLKRLREEAAGLITIE